MRKISLLVILCASIPVVVLILFVQAAILWMALEHVMYCRGADDVAARRARAIEERAAARWKAIDAAPAPRPVVGGRWMPLDEFVRRHP